MLTTSDFLLQSAALNPSGEDLRRKAAQVFRNQQFYGFMHRVAAFLRREPPALADLQLVSRSGRVLGSHYNGLRTVEIDAIHGSEARSADFDHHFHPLNCRSLSRFIGIFQARLRNQPLPPVDLIKVGGEYYVRDGHHRICVARALGETYIEAEVTIWEVAR